MKPTEGLLAPQQYRGSGKEVVCWTRLLIYLSKGWSKLLIGHCDTIWSIVLHWYMQYQVRPGADQSWDGDVIMSAMASQITSLTIVYSIVYSCGYQRKHQSSASLAFVGGIHRWPVNSPHKGPVTRKMFPLDDVIMQAWIITSIVIPHLDHFNGSSIMLHLL